MAALLLVLGVMAILLVLGAVAATSARQELRLSRGEANAERVAIVVEGGFHWAAKQADIDSNWPTAPFVAGSTPCVPATPYPSYCVDAMARRPVSGTYQSVPLRVAYRVSATDPIGEAFGWIETDLSSKPVANKVIRIVPNHAWCEPPSPTDSGTGPCSFGG